MKKRFNVFTAMLFSFITPAYLAQSAFDFIDAEEKHEKESPNLINKTHSVKGPMGLKKAHSFSHAGILLIMTSLQVGRTSESPEKFSVALIGEMRMINCMMCFFPWATRTNSYDEL